MVFYLVVNPVQNDEKKEQAIPFAHLKGKTLNILNIVFIDFVFITCKFVYNGEEKNVKEEIQNRTGTRLLQQQTFWIRKNTLSSPCTFDLTDIPTNTSGESLPLLNNIIASN